MEPQSANPFGIKRVSAAGINPSTRLLDREAMNALVSAQDILDAANARAQSIIADAKTDAERIRDEARNAAEKQIWAEIEDALDGLKSAREQLSEQSIEVAQSILQKSWGILSGNFSDTERLQCALEQAGRYFVSTSVMKLRVNPASVADTQSWIETRRNIQPGLELLSIEPDISVRPDEVRLYLDRGGVICADFVGTLEILKTQWM